MEDAKMEMPRYQSHKEVWACKIKEIEFDRDRAKAENNETDGSAKLIFEEGGYKKVDFNYVNRHKPKVGGYFVVYKDGYQSWSPAEAFEEGYSRV